MSVEARLTELGIELPQPMNTAALPFDLVRADGDHLYLSGVDQCCQPSIGVEAILLPLLRQGSSRRALFLALSSSGWKACISFKVLGFR